MNIACSYCGATYMFDASLIPKEGYDARCTSCQGVFFVRPDGAADAHAQPGQEGQQSSGFDPKALHRGTLNVAAEAQQAPAGRPKLSPGAAAGGSVRARKSIDDDLDLGPRFGRGRNMEVDDGDTIMPPQRWARRGLFLGVALVAVVGTGVVVGVVCSKRLHAPPSVQPPIHIVRAPDPIAKEAFERGMKALWEDTSASYLAASKAFDAATARDREYTDAWAGAALAALMQSTDVEAQAQAAMRAAQGQAQQALLEVVAAARGLSGDGGDDEAVEGGPHGDDVSSVAQMLRLQKSQAALVQASQQQAELLHQKAHALQRRGASLLLHGDHLMTQTPLMSLALAMWYTADASSLYLARQQLRAYEQLVGGDCAPVETDPNNCVDSNPVTLAPTPPGLSEKLGEMPYGPVAFWIEARLIAQSSSIADVDQAVAAYEKALALEPGLRRARYELAQTQWRAGRTEVAKPLLEDLAHAIVPHEKSRFDLQKLMDGLNKNSRNPQ